MTPRRAGRAGRSGSAARALALAGALLVASAPAPAAGLRGIALQADNDEFAGPDRHDRWYTGGLRATALFDIEHGGAAQRLVDAWCATIRCARDGEALGFVTLGQNLYTQADRRREVPQPGDRPVGGWLYLRGGGVVDGSRRHDLVAFEIGLTGPGAQGKRAQDAMHDFLGVDRVPAWRYQLRPRTGVALRVQSARRFRLGEHSDMVAEGWLQLGNVDTHVGAGVGLRFGPALDGARLPAEARDAAPGVRGPARWHAVIGMRAKAVAWDGLVEGPAYGYSPTVRARPFVLEAFAGLAWRLRRNLDVAFTLSRRSSDFSGESLPGGGLGGHTIGAIRLGWRFER